MKQGSWSAGRHHGQSSSVSLKALLQFHFNMTDAAQSGSLNLLSIHTGSRHGAARQGTEIYTFGWQPVTYLINGIEQLATANSGLFRQPMCIYFCVIRQLSAIIYPSGLQPLSGVILSEIGQWMMDARKEILFFGLGQTTLDLNLNYFCKWYFALSCLLSFVMFCLGYGNNQ